MKRKILHIGALVILAASSAGAGHLLLDSWRVYPVGMEPYDICAADFNGDGLDDVAAVDIGDSVAVMMSKGGGVFEDEVLFWAAAPARAIDAADLDGDGAVDLALGVEHPVASIAIMFNDGRGGFRLPVYFGKSGKCRLIETADFNADGFVDIAGVIGEEIVVVFNWGFGIFSYPLKVGEGSGITDMTIGDLDDDGDIDLAVIDDRSNIVQVYANNGVGRFMPPVRYPTGSWPTYLTSADFNGDGMTDMAVSGSRWSSVTFFLNNGDGTFPLHGSFNVGVDNAVSCLTASDHDRDGDVDLFVCRRDSVFLSLVNNGAGEFVDRHVYSERYHRIVTADFTGDGYPDVAGINRDAECISILANDGFGMIASLPTYPLDGNGEAIAAADLTGDGVNDLAAIDYSMDQAAVYLNDGAGVFDTGTIYSVDDIPSDIALYDFDSDGDNDMIVGSMRTSAIQIMQNTGHGQFEPFDTLVAGQHLQALAAADFDGDADIDLAGVCSYLRDSAGTAYTDSVYIFRNTGAGTYEAGGVFYGGYVPVHVAAADLDADGDIDLAVAAAVDEITTLFNDGSGVFDSSVTYLVGLYQIGVDTADYDGDGDIDLLVGSRDSLSLSVLVNDGSGAFAVQRAGYVELPPTGCAFADLDNDGDADIVARSETYVFGATIVLINDGGTFGRPLYFGGGGQGLTVADLDNDGDVDIANADDHMVTIIFNRADMPTDIDDVSDEEPLPRTPMLMQNVPNPFNPVTRIGYSIPVRAHVTLVVYNILGQAVTTLVDAVQPAGPHTVRWNGADDTDHPVSTGIYLYRLTVDGHTETRRMILLK